MSRSIFLLLLCSAAHAEPLKLSESAKAGDHIQVTLNYQVSGKYLFEHEGKPNPVSMEAVADLSYLERIESIDRANNINKVIRHYQTAISKSTVGREKSQRELRKDRRLILMNRTENSAVHICPDGPMQRDELELVGEHFDTSLLHRVLSGTEVAVGDQWAIPASLTKLLCQLDEVSDATLVGKAVKRTETHLEFTINGIATGVELGAKAKVQVQAEGQYDVGSRMITKLVWSQTDQREQGPASPAANLTVKVEINRRPIAAQPEEFGPAVLRRVPADQIPSIMTYLSHTDGDGRYSFTYPREWVIVGQTRDHTILRWLDRGQFVAQLTIATWKKAEPGQHTPVPEYQAAISKIAGWKPSRTLDAGEIPVEKDRWLYREVAEGTQNGKEVVQSFYLLAAASGEQLAITVLCAPEHRKRLNDQEIELLKSLRFKEK